MSLQIRRVVTGVTSENKSIAYEDAVVDPFKLDAMPDVEFFQIWGTEGAIKSPLADPKPENHSFFPGPGGSRFGLFRLPPEAAAPAEGSVETPSESEAAAQFAEAESKLPGLLSVFEVDNPGMHQTTTIDYILVIEGVISVELDDGAEVDLPAGSCLVQNGARHGWRNHGDTPATLAYVILDASTNT